MTTVSTLSAVGRRKTAIANVRITPAEKHSVTVNGASLKAYFKTAERVRTAEEALTLSESAEHYAVTARVDGGGVAAQAEALRHAISRALMKAEPKTKPTLKTLGFLTRDARAKERKKPGLVKARKRKQWSKR